MPTTPTPKKLKIQNIKYNIREVKNLTDIDHKTGETLKFNGWCDAQKGDIALEKDMTFEHQQLTLSHEVLHGMLHMTHHRTKKYEESLCIDLAPILIDFIRDNPAVLKYLSLKSEPKKEKKNG